MKFLRYDSSMKYSGGFMSFEISLVQRIQRSIDYVESHICEPIELENVAKVAYMSQASYYAIFSKMFDGTLKNYITKRRITIAAFQLVHSDESILNIALNICYGSSEAFSRKFKKFYGVSPSDYRRKGEYIEWFPAVNLIDARRNLIQGGKIMTLTKSMNNETLGIKISHHVRGYLMDIDIDKFAYINENYGWDTGDFVLREVATRINQALVDLSIDSTAIRIAGDEFAVVLRDLPKRNVELLAKQIIASMKPLFIFNEKSLHVTVSLGITHYDSKGLEDVKQSAYDAMIDAKKKGRNTYVFI